MSVTLTSLEALILKATHESLSQPDDPAIEAFCSILRDAPDGPILAAQCLALRIQSLNSHEAFLGLIMLDRCMRRCDANFHAEIGKFRFLNEMIKLVSPKYYADRTSAEVRTRVVQLLHAWSIEYPKENKFKVAFDMLKNQGVITETPPPLPPEDIPIPCRSRDRNTIFEDEEKSKLLQKLLRSKKPEDLQHANKLIKTMVREEERRNEANSRRAKEVGAALDSAELLADMLEHANDASPEEEQLMEELHHTCQRYRPILERLAANNTQPSVLNQILLAGDVLDDVTEKYKVFEDSKRRAKLGNPTLLDFAGAINGKDNTEGSRKARNLLDELGIYDQRTLSCALAGLLKPQSNTPQNLMETNDDETPMNKGSKAEGWDVLDTLGEQLLKQSLPENAKRADSFNNKSAKKVPMNAFEKSSPKRDPQPSSNGAFFDLDFLMKPPDVSPARAESPRPAPPPDDVMVDISPDPRPPAKSNNSQSNSLMDMMDLVVPDNHSHSNNLPVIKEELEDLLNNDSLMGSAIQPAQVQPLTDIFVTLSDVQPSEVPPVTAYEEENGLSIVLHFCTNKPRPDVNVIVISTTSKHTSPITDYKLQAVVPQCCKVRLLPPSATSLPAYNPFMPPPALTQVMLLAGAAGAGAGARAGGVQFALSYATGGASAKRAAHLAPVPLGML